MKNLKIYVSNLIILLLFGSISAQTPTYHVSSSTTIGGFSWGSNWYWQNANHDLKYAEANVQLTWTEELSEPSYLNVNCAYSQQTGNVLIDVYISTEQQIIMDMDNPYNHMSWWNGDVANPGNYLGQIVAPGWGSGGILASFNIDDWILNNPNNKYYLLFENHNNTNDATVFEAWIGPYQSITNISENNTSSSVYHSQIGNYPNPISSSTTIEYSLKTRELIKMTIYDEKGKIVKTLINNDLQNKGRHQIIWNTTNNSGHLVVSGMYFIHLKTPSQILQKKLIVIR